MRINRLSENLTYLTRDLKKNEIAKAIEMSPSVFSGYVHGKTSPPIDVLLRLANHFELGLDDLVSGPLGEPINYVSEPEQPYGDNARLCYMDPETGEPVPNRRLFLPGLPPTSKPWLMMINPLHGMEPSINVGDMMIFRAVDNVVQFSVCMVSAGGHAYLGRVKQDVDEGVEIIRIVAENKSVPTVDIPREHVTGFYKIDTAYRAEKF